MRIFAILHEREEIDIGKNIIEKLPEGSKVMIFSKEDFPVSNFPQNSLEFVKIPEDLTDKKPKMRNFIIRTVKNSGFNGFLHVAEDSVALKTDPKMFFDEVELMMKTFGLKSWFNTALDGCNYVLSQYNPRFSVTVDVENTPLSGKTIHWCSNANTEWTVFDLEGATDDDLMLNESFGIAMYFIIEFLARRRNRKSPGELHYMNMYPGLDSELPVLQTVPSNPDENHKEDFKAEDQIFREMKVDNRPDMEIEGIIRDMAAKLGV